VENRNHCAIEALKLGILNPSLSYIDDPIPLTISHLLLSLETPGCGIERNG